MTRKVRSARSGRSLTHAEHLARGNELVRAWVPRELVTRMRAECAELELSVAEWLRRLIAAELGGR